MEEIILQEIVTEHGRAKSASPPSRDRDLLGNEVKDRGRCAMASGAVPQRWNKSLVDNVGDNHALALQTSCFKPTTLGNTESS